MNQPVKRKRIPYGMMNFIDVREDDCYYVDKTHYIPLIENANKYFFYIRPRRFGKSYFINNIDDKELTDKCRRAVRNNTVLFLVFFL